MTDHRGQSCGQLELVAYPRIGEYFEEKEQYIEYVKRGGRYPFVSCGKPRFEVDLVVSRVAQDEIPLENDYILAYICG